MWHSCTNNPHLTEHGTSTKKLAKLQNKSEWMTHSVKLGKNSKIQTYNWMARFTHVHSLETCTFLFGWWFSCFEI